MSWRDYCYGSLSMSAGEKLAFWGGIVIGLIVGGGLMAITIVVTSKMTGG